MYFSLFSFVLYFCFKKISKALYFCPRVDKYLRSAMLYYFGCRVGYVTCFKAIFKTAATGKFSADKQELILFLKFLKMQPKVSYSLCSECCPDATVQCLTLS